MRGGRIFQVRNHTPRGGETEARDQEAETEEVKGKDERGHTSAADEEHCGYDAEVAEEEAKRGGGGSLRDDGQNHPGTAVWIRVVRLMLRTNVSNSIGNVSIHDAGGGHDGWLGYTRRRGGDGARGHALCRQGEVLSHLGLLRGIQGLLFSQFDVDNYFLLEMAALI